MMQREQRREANGAPSATFLDEAIRNPSSLSPRTGFPIGLHLAPHLADDVLGDGAFEQCCKRPLHPPRVGARQVGRRNQRLRLLRHPRIARQRPRCATVLHG
jgi:hypothetical protein